MNLDWRFGPSCNDARTPEGVVGATSRSRSPPLAVADEAGHGPLGGLRGDACDKTAPERQGSMPRERPAMAAPPVAEPEEPDPDRSPQFRPDSVEGCPGPCPKHPQWRGNHAAARRRPLREAPRDPDDGLRGRAADLGRCAAPGRGPSGSSRTGCADITAERPHSALGYLTPKEHQEQLAA
jgi:hypothetical protein